MKILDLFFFPIFSMKMLYFLTFSFPLFQTWC
uniref:Uncharacterized protein n=1 Tax=Rhizophora mucronata TaxID=61149 RepID=A0A2P2NR56_RHIMU